MDARATVIISVPHQTTGLTASMVLHSVTRTMALCAEAGLDALVVAPQAALNAWHDWCQSSQPSVVNLPPCSEQQLLAVSLRVGVQMSSKSCGWLLVPADILMLKSSTFSLLGETLRHHLIVHATVAQQPRLPVGFGQELFSELIHLDSDHALYRLMNRYPTQPVEVDDPGVLMRPWHPMHALPPGHVPRPRHTDV